MVTILSLLSWCPVRSADEAGATDAPGTPSEDMERWVVGRTLEDAQAATAAQYPGRQVASLSQDEDVLDTW
jgi:valyl-tRNA synthetase